MFRLEPQAQLKIEHIHNYAMRIIFSKPYRTTGEVSRMAYLEMVNQNSRLMQFGTPIP